MITTLQRQDGQYIAVGAIEVTHLPDINSGEDTVRLRLKRDRELLVTCLTQIIMEHARHSRRAFIELLMETTPARDRMTAGAPHLYMVVYILNRTDLYRETAQTLHYMKEVLGKIGYGCNENVSHKQLFNHMDKLNHTGFKVSLVPQGTIGHAADVTETLADAMLPAMMQYPHAGVSLLLFKQAGEEKLRMSSVLYAPDNECNASLYRNFIHAYRARFKSYVLTQPVSIDYINLRLALGNKQNSPVSETEIQKCFCLPTGGNLGFPVAEEQVPADLLPSGIVPPNEKKDCPGSLFIGNHRSNDRKIYLPLHNLLTHTCVLGSSGCGKTTLITHLCMQLWKRLRTPFLILDLEGHDLCRRLAPVIKEDLVVITPGDNSVSPFEYNLFLPPFDMPLGLFKQLLVNYLRDALDLTETIMAIIKRTLDSLYCEHGWTETKTGTIFTLKDFLERFDKIFNEDCYHGEARNNIPFFKNRLEKIRPYFSGRKPFILQSVIYRPTIIEFRRIQDPEERAALLLYFLHMQTAFLRERHYDGKEPSVPDTVTVLEELHNLFDIQLNALNDRAQLRLQETIRRLLVESRKFGISYCVSDQRYSIVQSLFHNCSTKIVFHLSENSKEVEEAMNLKSGKLPRQTTGECYFHTSGMSFSMPIRTPKPNER